MDVEHDAFVRKVDDRVGAFAVAVEGVEVRAVGETELGIVEVETHRLRERGRGLGRLEVGHEPIEALPPVDVETDSWIDARPRDIGLGPLEDAQRTLEQIDRVLVFSLAELGPPVVAQRNRE